MPTQGSTPTSGRVSDHKNADLINEGFFELDEGERFKIQYTNNQEGIVKNIIEEIKGLYNPNNPFATQVLAPVYKAPAGVASLNNSLQGFLNPAKGEKELRYGDRTFRKKDKVILLSNNYTVGYYNGDVGIISEIRDAYIVVQLADKQICLTRELMENIDLAYWNETIFVLFHIQCPSDFASDWIPSSNKCYKAGSAYQLKMRA